MKTLLAYLYNNFEFLYLNSEYRITDSSTDGNATVNASIRFSGPLMAMSFVNDRGQIACAVAPSENDSNWSRISIVRQYLDGLEDEPTMSSADTATWVSTNFPRIESLFSPASLASSVADLRTLKRASADKRFGPA